MCQESLINYLTRSLNVSEMAIRDFILVGDFMASEDTSPTRRRQNGGMYISDELFAVRDEADGKVTVLTNRLGEMDDALRNIRVVDPAVGSGAFPLGMLNEIVKARSTITSYICIPLDYKTRRDIHISDRSMHQLKLDTVRDCIFAADIEPSAVDIAKLRLWLSLVIDDELVDDPLFGHNDPLPLPNLECNIVCGNSLLDQIDGIKLINQSKILGTERANTQINFMEDSFNATVRKLIEKQQELFVCEDTDKKHQILEQIDLLRDAVIRTQLEGASPEIKEHYETTRNEASKPYVLWQLEFARVFREKGGFDVCIGNPPYGAKISAAEKKVYGRIYECAKTVKGVQKGSTDTFALFVEKGMSLCTRGNAFLAYIIPMSFTSSDSMTALHKMVEDTCESVHIASFSNRPKQIFDAACIRTSIIMLSIMGAKIKHLYTTKLIRRTEENTIANIVSSLQYVDSLPYKKPGRYPKVGSEMDIDILKHILPLFAFDFTRWDEAILFCFFFIVVGYLCIHHNYYCVNVILDVMQYRFYECDLENPDGITTTMTVISRKRLNALVGEEISIKELNDDFSFHTT